MLGSERVWVVHGADGLDEISTTGYTKVSEGHDGTVRTFHVHPGDFGLQEDDARPSMPAATRARTRRSCGEMLAAQPGPVRDIVLLNAGAGLFVAGRAGVGARGHRRGGRGRGQRARAGATLERAGARDHRETGRHERWDQRPARRHRRGHAMRASRMPRRVCQPPSSRARSRRCRRRAAFRAALAGRLACA